MSDSTAQTRAKELFLAALELENGERAAFVERETRADPELARRVEALLAAHVALESSAVELFRAGDVVGAYTLVERLGEGGFGEVWRARQETPLKREVALKLLKAGLDSREVLARFALEREALARMQHPGIARVFDAGATPRGRPWIALELVHGAPLTEYAERASLDLAARVRLLAAVAHAVQHAHTKGIAHRDLKPHNVLVGELDHQPAPKVIDFGIARALHGEDDAPRRTRQGARIGTPAYMSPEQLDGAGDVDAQSDVWALGALLYELVAGEPPFPASGATPDALDDQRRARAQLPERPSVRARRRARKRLAREAAREIDWVALRALEPERAQRYTSAGELARELERWLAGLGVEAGPPSVRRRAGRFIRRHRVATAAAALVFLSLALGALVALDQAREARAAERSAQAELARFTRISGFLEGVFSGLEPNVAQGRDATLLLDMLARLRADLDKEDARDPVVEATLRRVLGAALFALGRLDEAEPELARALELRRATPGVDPAETARALVEWSALLQRRGRAQEALEGFEQAWEVLSRALGAQHATTLLAQAGRAQALVDLGRAAEALPVLEELVATRARTLGEDDAASVRALNSQAHALDVLGRSDEALALWRRALELQLRARGAEHPESLAAMHNVATQLLERGELAEAEALLRRAAEAKARVLPRGHPSRIASWGNLAQALQLQKRDDEALAIYARAVEELDGRVESVEALSLGYNRANALLKAGQHAQVERELAALLEGARRAAVGRPNLIAMAQSLRGDALRELGRASEAEPLTRASAEVVDQVLPQDDLGRAVLRARHAKVLRALGREDEARALFTDAARVAEELGNAGYAKKVRALLDGGS